MLYDFFLKVIKKSVFLGLRVKYFSIGFVEAVFCVASGDHEQFVFSLSFRRKYLDSKNFTARFEKLLSACSQEHFKHVFCTFCYQASTFPVENLEQTVFFCDFSEISKFF